MSELTITEIDEDLMRYRGGKSWVSNAAWILIRNLEPGQMIEMTAAVPQTNSFKAITVNLWASLKLRGLGHLRPCRRENRIFIVYWPEQHNE